MIYKNESSSLLVFIANILEYQRTRTQETLLHKHFYGKERTYLPKRNFAKHAFAYNVYTIHGNDQHIIYLHGGAYVLKGNRLHFSFIKELHKKTNATIHYIDYEVAPNEVITQILVKVLETIEVLIKTYKIDHLYMMGDSAGGGMALPITRDILKKHSIIKGVFLLSPWLDVTMSNPDIMHVAHNESMFTKEELIQCGNLYTNSFSSNIDASPIFSDYSYIGPIHIFQGTRDLLYKDAELFHSRNKNVDLYVYKEALHTFMLFPFVKEKKAVISKISMIMNYKKSE